MTKRIEIKYNMPSHLRGWKTVLEKQTNKQKLISQNVFKNVKEKQQGNLTDMIELGPKIWQLLVKQT